MRITITQDFNTLDEAAAFIERLGADQYVVATETEPVLGTDKALPGKVRKPRADAGKKREPYGPRTTETAAPETAGASQREGTGTTAGAANSAPAAPTLVAGLDGPTQGAASAAAVPTLADARAAMKKLNDAEGMGVCIESLKKYGVTRISDLKPELFADFIKYVLGKLPAAK